MHELIITGLDDATIQRLRQRADAHGRSLEDEIKHLLTWGVDYIERVQGLARTMKPMKSVARDEKEDKPAFDLAAQRARIEQMLNEASARDAKLQDEWDQLFGELNHLRKGHRP